MDKSTSPSNIASVDKSRLSESELKIYEKYGKLPNTKDLMRNKMSSKDRKFFDSGDYALNMAGNTVPVGTKIPSPENIPHSTSDSKQQLQQQQPISPGSTINHPPHEGRHLHESTTTP